MGVKQEFEEVMEIYAQLIEDEQMDIDPSVFHWIDPRQIHEFVSLSKRAFTDGYYLIFVNGDIKFAQKFLYYIGAENEATLKLFTSKIIIYSDISEGRLGRFIPDDSL